MSPTWMNRTKEAEAARQAALYARRKAAGNCIRCGFKAADGSVQLCERHLAKQRGYANARNAKKRAAAIAAQAVKAQTVKNGRANLRGRIVTLTIDGKEIRGTVITHIRNGRWLIESRSLPQRYQRGAGWWTVRRITLPEAEFTVEAHAS